MVTNESFYTDEITSKSFTELKNLSKWMNKNYKKFPTVIGGWAVWCYYDKGFRSRDIDLVLQNYKTVEKILYNQYFPHFGVEKYRMGLLGQEYYAKKTVTKKGNEKIIFDIFYGGIMREDRERLGVIVDWKWIIANQIKNKFDDTFIYVPKPELLLTLKMIAVLSRNRSRLIQKETDYTRSKIWKDYYDIAILIQNAPIAKTRLLKFLKMTHFTKKLLLDCEFGYEGQLGVSALERANVSISTITDFFKQYAKIIK
ncbi:MAG TPA: nucleotidyl transferase AbiEii/AbiGii toxin family protein [Nitrososphaeraceae archaeon]|nr:nucleotidyl transferase AbiEii/AbiGii toxin family protein [Nitrososphaeraceae archaeon]